MLLLSQSIPFVLPALDYSYYTSPWSAVFFVTFQGTKKRVYMYTIHPWFMRDPFVNGW